MSADSFLTKPGEILPGLRPPIVQLDWITRLKAGGN
jgi:hypothetical protein